MNSIARSCQLLLARSKPRASSLSTLSAVNSKDLMTRSLKSVVLASKGRTSTPPQLYSAQILTIRNFASETNNPLSKEHFEMLVNNNKVVVFMKGNPEEPRCGFSNAVVQILRMHGVTNYDAHDVLQDENVRQGIKDFTNWPTIPQIFINGEFVGGCDILIEMHKNGELVEQLSKVGIKSALLETEKKNGK